MSPAGQGKCALSYQISEVVLAQALGRNAERSLCPFLSLRTIDTNQREYKLKSLQYLSFFKIIFSIFNCGKVCLI